MSKVEATMCLWNGHRERDAPNICETVRKLVNAVGDLVSL